MAAGGHPFRVSLSATAQARSLSAAANASRCLHPNQEIHSNRHIVPLPINSQRKLIAMDEVRNDGSIAEITIDAPWVVSVSEVFHIDYSDEENCLMLSPTLFHAWRPLEGGARLAIEVSNQHGTNFGVIVARILPPSCPPPGYLPCEGYTFSSVKDVISCVECLAVKWRCKDPPHSAKILDG